MGVQIAANDKELNGFYRSCRFSKKLSAVAAAQYVSMLKSMLGAMSAPSDVAGLAQYVAMLAPSSRVKVYTVWRYWRICCADIDKKLKIQRAKFPTEDEIQKARSQLVAKRPSTDALQALRLLAAICDCAPKLIAQRQWNDIYAGEQGATLKVVLGGRGRIYHQSLGPLGSEALKVLRREFYGSRQPSPHSVLFPMIVSDPTFAPQRKLLEAWMHEAGVASSGTYLENAVEANLAALPETL